MINLDQQFSNILEKYNKIENSLNSMDNISSERLIKLNREYAELKPIVDKIAEIELFEKKNLIKELESDLLKLLIPKDENDKKNSILEIRAGTGGDEASLFAADLFSMYQKYADINSWTFEILSIS